MLKHVPSLIEEGRLFLLRAPLYGFYLHDECIAIAYSDNHAEKVFDALTENLDAVPVKRRYKGIASLDSNMRVSLLASDNPARNKLTLQDCRQICQPLL